MPQQPSNPVADQLDRAAESFSVDEHLFYMKAREFFNRTRQAHWTRSQVIARLEKIQDEVRAVLAPHIRDGEPEEDWARKQRIEEEYEKLHPHFPGEGR